MFKPQYDRFSSDKFSVCSSDDLGVVSSDNSVALLYKGVKFDDAYAQALKKDIKISKPTRRFVSSLRPKSLSPNRSEKKGSEETSLRKKRSNPVLSIKPRFQWSNNDTPSEREFNQIDLDGDNSASKEDIGMYVDSKAELWCMLSVNIPNITEEECRAVATRVVMELASGKTGDDALRADITKQQFKQFRRKYLFDPKGSQEFFHRTVFAAFDVDRNGVLCSNELDKLLDIFYEGDSIFKGDARLPERSTLKNIIYEKLDANNDGLIAFEEIRSLISGSMASILS